MFFLSYRWGGGGGGEEVGLLNTNGHGGHAANENGCDLIYGTEMLLEGN